MEQVLSGMELYTALVYLDHILVHAKSFAEHLQHLRLVLERLRIAEEVLPTAALCEVPGPRDQQRRCGCG